MPKTRVQSRDLALRSLDESSPQDFGGDPMAQRGECCAAPAGVDDDRTLSPSGSSGRCAKRIAYPACAGRGLVSGCSELRERRARRADRERRRQFLAQRAQAAAVDTAGRLRRRGALERCAQRHRGLGAERTDDPAKARFWRASGCGQGRTPGGLGVGENHDALDGSCRLAQACRARRSKHARAAGIWNRFPCLLPRERRGGLERGSRNGNDNPRMRCLPLIAIVLGASTAACTPAFDWREVHPAGSGATLEFPCKPQSRTRVAMLDGEAVAMTMVSCSTQGLNFALVHADVGDPARVTPALIALRAALAANAQARELGAVPFVLDAMTPNENAVRVRYAGRSPQGAPIEEEAAFFSRGMRVYQLAVVGATLDAASVGVFFDSLRLQA